PARVVIRAGQFLERVIVGANNHAFLRIGPKRRDDVPEGVDTPYCQRAQVSFFDWIEPLGKIWRNGRRLLGYCGVGKYEHLMNVRRGAVQILGMRAIPRKESLG